MQARLAPTHRRWAILVALVLVVCAAPGAEAREVPPRWRIGFTSNRTGTAQVWTMEPDGSDQRQLTFETADHLQPTWSPDGRFVAFSRGVGYQSGNFVSSSIVVLDTVLGTERVLASSDGINFRPAWSPTGERIVFVRGSSSPTQTPFDLWLADPNGTNLEQLTDTGDATQPAWSPDGRTIVFNRGTQIWAVGADGTGARQLTFADQGEGSNFTPTWAPGERIAFTSDRSGGAKQVFVMDPDGSNQHQITSGASEAKYPTWTPNGRSIVFSGSTVPCVPDPPLSECSLSPIGGYEIFRIDVDGTDLLQLTQRTLLSTSQPAPGSQFGDAFPVYFRDAPRGPAHGGTVTPEGEAVVDAMYGAIFEGNLTAALSHCHPDAQHHCVTPGPVSGIHSMHDYLAELLPRASKDMDQYSIRSMDRDVLDELIVCRVRTSHGSGVLVYRVVDGRITDRWVINGKGRDTTGWF